MTDKQLIKQLLIKANIEFTTNKFAILIRNNNIIFLFDEKENLYEILDKQEKTNRVLINQEILA